MRKYFILIAVLLLGVIGYAQNRTASIWKGRTFVDNITFNASDTINEDETYYVEITNKQDFPQMFDIWIDLDSVSGTPGVTVTVYGKTFESSTYASIGSAVTYAGTADTTFNYPVNTAQRYRYLKVEFVADATDQQSLVSDVIVKAWNTGGLLNSSSVAITGTLSVSGASTLTGTIASDANGETLVSATGVTAVNYVSGANRTVVTFTDYAMVVTDSEGQGGHGTLKLIDFPEGMIDINGVVGDIGITAVAGMGATSTFDMALGSATTAVDQETLDGTNVDIVAKVDGTLVASADDIDLVNVTLQQKDGHTASTDVWLCLSVTDSDMTATGTMTFSGTIVITWTNLGDY